MDTIFKNENIKSIKKRDTHILDNKVFSFYENEYVHITHCRGDSYSEKIKINSNLDKILYLKDNLVWIYPYSIISYFDSSYNHYAYYKNMNDVNKAIEQLKMDKSFIDCEEYSDYNFLKYLI